MLGNHNPDRIFQMLFCLFLKLPKLCASAPGLGRQSLLLGRSLRYHNAVFLFFRARYMSLEQAAGSMFLVIARRRDALLQSASRSRPGTAASRPHAVPVSTARAGPIPAGSPALSLTHRHSFSVVCNQAFDKHVVWPTT